MSDTSEFPQPKLKLESVHLFVRTANESSFRKAADKLNMSPAAVKEHVDNLERDLGITLFERSRTGIRLTRAGQEILQQADQILRASNRLTEYAKGLGDGSSGTVSIACYPVHVERFLGNVMGDFAKEHPGVRIDLSQMRDDRRRTWGRSLFEELRDGHVDLAIGPPHVQSGLGLDGFKIYIARIVALLPDSDDDRGSKSIPISMLKGKPLLIAPEGFFSRERVTQAARESGFELTVALQSSNPPALLTLGRNGLGIPVLPDDYPLVGQQRFPYPVILDRSGMPIQTEVWLHWRAKTLLPESVKEFIECAKQAVQNEARSGRRYEEYYKAEIFGFDAR